jgi:beta-exotoxin I transport system permease protein
MTIAWRMIRDRRRSTVWWIVGTLVLVVFTVSLYPSFKGQAEFEDVVRNLPAAVRAMSGFDPAVPLTSPAGYLQGRMFASLVPLMLVVFGIGAGAQAIGGFEESGQLEPLLANPVTRGRVAVERYLAGVALLALLVAVLAFATFGLAVAFDALSGVRITGLFGASAAAGALALLHHSLAYAIGSPTGRRGPAIGTASAVAVAGYVIYNLLSVVESLAPLRFITPWYWYLQRNMLAKGVPPAAILVPVALSAVLSAAGWAVFRRRDLR